MSLIWPFSVSISMQMHPLHHRPTVGSYIYTDTALTLLPWQRQDQKYFGLLKLRFRVILTEIHFLELWTFGVIDSSYYSWIHSHLMEEWPSILFSVPVLIQIILDFFLQWISPPEHWCVQSNVKPPLTSSSYAPSLWLLLRRSEEEIAAAEELISSPSELSLMLLARHHDFSSSVEF